VQPVEGEHRAGVLEPQRGDLHRRRPVAVGDPAGEDLAQVFRAGCDQASQAESGDQARPDASL
jgi:hypothetical protein